MSVYKFPETYFEERLRNIGLNKLDTVLDAACGQGDWLPALAKLNKNVLAFDYDKISLINTKHLLATDDFYNTKIFVANMMTIPIKNNIFDAIFCFDSLMFANPLHTLIEFKRILKPGGKLYLSVNGLGWILKCFWERGIQKYNISKVFMSIRILYDTFIRIFINENIKNQNTVFTKRNIKKIAHKTGYRIISVGYEGSFNNTNFTKYPPCFEEKYFNIPTSLEAILEKHV